MQIATKLNRSHLVNGEIAYCCHASAASRSIGRQADRRNVSMEDSTARFHGSRGMADPVSPQLRSEPPSSPGSPRRPCRGNPRIDWDAWVGDYALVRKAIEATYPTVFHDLNGRMFDQGGLAKTASRPASGAGRPETGKANFAVPGGSRPIPTCRSAAAISSTSSPCLERPVQHPPSMAITTFPGHRRHARRAVHEPRRYCPARLRDGGNAEVETVSDDGVSRRLGGLRVVAYDIPQGNCGGYYPR